MDTPDRAHPRRLSPDAYLVPNLAAFITVNTKGRRSCLAADAGAGAVIAALAQFVPNPVAYCVMPDHLHFVYVTVAERTLPMVVSQFKGKAAYMLHRLGHEGEIWQRSYWDRYARRDDDIAAMVQYVLDNPVRRGLCRFAHEWPYSRVFEMPW